MKIFFTLEAGQSRTKRDNNKFSGKITEFY